MSSAAAAAAAAGGTGLVLHLAPAAAALPAPLAAVPAAAAAASAAAAAASAAAAAASGAAAAAAPAAVVPVIPAAAAAAAAAVGPAAGAPPPGPAAVAAAPPGPAAGAPPPGPAPGAPAAPPGPTAEQIAINAYTGINDRQSFQDITTIITKYHTHYPIELMPLHHILELTDVDVPEENRISLNTLSYVYLYSNQIKLHLGDPEFKYIRKQIFDFFSEVYRKYNPIITINNKRKFKTFPLPLPLPLPDQQYIGEDNDNFSEIFLSEFNTIVNNMNLQHLEIGHRKDLARVDKNDFAEWYLYLYFLQDAHTRLIDEVNNKLKFRGRDDPGTETTPMAAGVNRIWHTKYPLLADSVFKENPQTLCDLLPIKDKTAKEFDLLDSQTLPAIWKLCDEIFS